MDRGAWQATVHGVARIRRDLRLNHHSYHYTLAVADFFLIDLPFPEYNIIGIIQCTVFLGGLNSKQSACNAGDLGSIPVLGRSPGGGHDNPPQYSCLENPQERGTWRATVHGVTKSQT